MHKHPLQILDGGMGGELIARKVNPSSGIWSASALLEAPEIVCQIHDDFINAGARVITTNSYSTVPSYLAKADMAERFEELTAVAAELARETALRSEHNVQVAGSLPPLDESYRFDLVPEDELSRDIYRRLVAVLASRVDLYICETMSCAREAVNAAAAARALDPDKPLWISWTLHEQPGNGLRSGESLVQALQAVESFAPDAYLFNCTSPEAISAGLVEIASLTDKPIGAYPNLFHVPEGWTLDNDISTEPRSMDEAEFADFATQWRAAGASIIGGCCGIGPKFIASLAQMDL